MVTVTQKDLKNITLRLATRSIYNCTKFSPKRARVVAKACRKLDDEFILVDGLYDKLIEEFGKHDEQGNIVPQPGGAPGSFIIEEGKEEAFENAIKETELVTVDIEGVNFTMDDLEVVGNLSPAQIDALEPFIVGDLVAVP